MVPPELSVVVVNFNTRHLLDRCLRSAQEGAPGRSTEWIVVDNASADGSVEHLRSAWPRVQLITNAENRGYAPACNQGLRVARGRFQIALNSDAFPAPGALEVLIRHLEENPGTAAVGPRLLNADGTTQWVCARRAPRALPLVVSATLLPSYFPSLLPWVWGYYPKESYAHAHPVDVLSGACIVWRREALERHGLLDERFVLNYDDIEWSLRAIRAGERLDYQPAAEVVHLGSQSRPLDADYSSMADLVSALAFYEAALGPASFAPKLLLAGSIATSWLKNAVLAPFSAARRARMRNRRALLGRCLSSLGRSTGPAEVRLAD